MHFRRIVACVVVSSSVSAGCGGPNKANVELRKQNQDLQAKSDRLQKQHDADLASMTAMSGSTTQPAIASPQQLASLFTAADLQIDETFTGYRQPALKVYVTPMDAANDPLKAAGSFHVEAFNLADKDHPAVGQWDFELAQASGLWKQSPLFIGYVLPCPLPAAPAGELTVRVSFVDALTQRTLHVQSVVKPRGATTRASK